MSRLVLLACLLVGCASWQQTASCAGRAVEALGEVNAARAKRGLKPFAPDARLTAGAKRLAVYRAERLQEGHTDNDFRFLPAGSGATAIGCGASADSWGWQTCCTYDSYAFAGAAWCRGRDGRRYMHLVVK